MADRDLTRRRVLALSGAAAGAALGIGISSCSKRAPEPDRHPGSGAGPTDGSGAAGRSGPEGQDARRPRQSPSSISSPPERSRAATSGAAT
ncbi:twin-arginine translocation signal domain-containing protein [Streptomyces sp. NPDC001914]|uniref:twin-arginine translocation signal domain-containing protein n=1 Tax=Streptomyces sp. NPDC001914 TaxID=3364623 RepID=UPI00368CBDF1